MGERTCIECGMDMGNTFEDAVKHWREWGGKQVPRYHGEGTPTGDVHNPLEEYLTL